MGICESCSNKEISNILNNSIVRIEFENDCYTICTGFFIVFNIRKIKTYFIMTCNHLITEEDIDSKQNIIIYYGKYEEEKSLKIKLDKKHRFIKSYKDLDVTLIEINKTDYIPEDKYLSPNSDLNDNFAQFENEKIYTGGYQNSQDLKVKKFFSSGKITKVFEQIFYHNINDRNSSHGSPIITNKILVIGMNIGYSKDKNYNYNYGVFIKHIIDRLTEDTEKELQIINLKDPSIYALIAESYKFQKYLKM